MTRKPKQIECRNCGRWIYSDSAFGIGGWQVCSACLKHLLPRKR